VEPFHVASGADRPVCERCGTRMMLARIEPYGRDGESRSFECPKCDHVQVERTPTDPIDQCKGWLSSELRRPT
jgi:tRNA(Ile2) C34 agmatinyltransferase TiaS